MKMSKLHAYLGQATDKSAKPVAKELKDKDVKIVELTKQLRNMILESDDEVLKSWKFEDEFLVRFIRGRKYNMESALDKLSNNVHSKRNQYPEIFATLYPSALRAVLANKSMRVLKHRDALGRQVCIFRPDYFDPNINSLDDLLRYQIMVVWEMMSFKETQLNGIIVVVDGAGFSAKQLKVLTPYNIQKYVNLSVKCSPTRFKGCHILYLPHVMQMGMQIVKPFLPDKVRSRLFFHGNNLNVFYKMIPQTILPDWIGGTLSEKDAIDLDLENAMLGKDDYYKDLIQ